MLFSLCRYQFWLEAYLTNGKVYTSNVLEVETRSESMSDAATDGAETGPLVAAGGHGDDDHSSSAMGTIVASCVAALAIVGLVVVTALYLKRTTTYKAIISGGGNRRRSELPISSKDFSKGVSFSFTLKGWPLCGRHCQQLVLWDKDKAKYMRLYHQQYCKVDKLTFLLS